jgi:O-antigen/teichoic acid export membrane protein
VAAFDRPGPPISSGKILRGAVGLTVGQCAAYGLSFVRNIILARMLTRADFGLAAAFGMTIGLLELAGRMSFGQQVVQSPEGDSEEFQSTSQAFQFIAGTASALLMAALSAPLAHLFKAPGAAWAFALLALVPLLKGFEHLDVSRRQREMEYRPAVLAELVPQLAVTAAAWPVAAWFRDFRAFLWLILGKSMLTLLMTHLLGRRRYQWAWSRDMTKGMVAFGWPLVINGFIMFASQQGDQMMVGAAYSLNDLALFSVAGSLATIPWFVFGQVASSIILPFLSRVQDSPEAFRTRYRWSAEFAAMASVVTAIPMVVAGEQIVLLMYGGKYSGAGRILAWLGAASSFRFLRLAPAVAAIARADTQTQMFSNLFRATSLLLVLAAVYLRCSIETVAACALIGEVIAFSATIYRLRRLQSVRVPDSLKPALYLSGCLIGAGALVIAGSQSWSLLAVGAGGIALLATTVIAAQTLFRESAGQLRRQLFFLRNAPASWWTYGQSPGSAAETSGRLEALGKVKVESVPHNRGAQEKFVGPGEFLLVEKQVGPASGKLDR